MDEMIRILAAELGKEPKHIENVVQLLDEGNTIPFIARYRKELHGAMDDTTLRTLDDPATIPARPAGAPGRPSSPPLRPRAS